MAIDDNIRMQLGEKKAENPNLTRGQKGLGAPL